MPNDPMDNMVAAGLGLPRPAYAQYSAVHYGRVEGVDEMLPYVHPQQVADLHAEIEQLREDLDSINSLYGSLREDHERLREVLGWYADPANYRNAVVEESGPGVRARDALSRPT